MIVIILRKSWDKNWGRKKWKWGSGRKGEEDGRGRGRKDKDGSIICTSLCFGGAGIMDFEEGT